MAALYVPVTQTLNWPQCQMGNPQNSGPKLSDGLVYSQLVRKVNLTLALTISLNPSNSNSKTVISIAPPTIHVKIDGV